MRALLGLCFAAMLISACQCQPGSALAITVDLKSSAARCVIAGVRVEATAVEFRSDKAVRRGTKSSLIFGIDRSGGIKGKVMPFARGYLVSDCASVSATSPFDEVAVGPVVDLDLPGVQRATLALVGAGAGDGGVDGGEPDGGEPDAGEIDAGADGGDGGLDGGDGGCVPAAAENCLDGADNTCDGLTDCADPGCNALPCAGGGTCGAQPDGGPACLQPTESLCGDLTDNDGDGTIDCADPDCAAKSCSDQNACTPIDVCSPFAVPDGGGFCDGGASISCTNTLPDCRATSGVCVPATGACSFAALDGGESCDDGVACTHSDRCTGAGSCAGLLYLCSTSQCVDAGTCLGDGGCAFVFASPTTGCDDLASCTHTDRCDGLGVCSGTGYSCASPPACFSGTACLGDGGCSWTFDGIGSGCPGGSCGPDAGCVPFANGFGFPPSNFNPAGIPDASIAPATMFAACTVEFDSTNNTFADGGWCNQTKPVPVVIVQDGGISTTVLAMASFSLGSGSRLILSGTRPVILAVYGPVDLQGVIDARSLDLLRVGPGGDYPGCGASNGKNATLSAGGGGAGFGTAGSPGGGLGAGAAGVAAAGNLTLQPLRGGCTGGRGHDSSNRMIADGGAGGGAVQISAASTLTVAGTVSVSGGGGRGGVTGASDDNGGGGAGSGGGILLEADLLQLTSSARLVANGGAGGGGRANGSGTVGDPGQSGSLDTAIAALGGKGGTPPAGDGGSGAAGSTPSAAGIPGVGTIGSGGGGAGLGVIRLKGITGCTIADAGLVVSGVVSKGGACP